MKKKLILSVKTVFIGALFLMFACSLFLCVNAIKEKDKGLVKNNYDFLNDDELDTDYENDGDQNQQDIEDVEIEDAQKRLIPFNVLLREMENDKRKAKQIEKKEKIQKLREAMINLQQKIADKKIQDLEKDLKKKQIEFGEESPEEESSFVWGEICGCFKFCYGSMTKVAKKIVMALCDGGSNSFSTVAYYGSRLGVFALVMLLIRYNNWDKQFIKWVVKYFLEMSFGMFSYVGEILGQAILQKIPGAYFVGRIICNWYPEGSVCSLL
jgi:hypothetical protein